MSVVEDHLASFHNWDGRHRNFFLYLTATSKGTYRGERDKIGNVIKIATTLLPLLLEHWKTEWQSEWMNIPVNRERFRIHYKNYTEPKESSFNHFMTNCRHCKYFFFYLNLIFTNFEKKARRKKMWGKQRCKWLEVWLKVFPQTALKLIMNVRWSRTTQWSMDSGQRSEVMAGYVHKITIIGFCVHLWCITDNFHSLHCTHQTYYIH